MRGRARTTGTRSVMADAVAFDDPSRVQDALDAMLAGRAEEAPLRALWALVTDAHTGQLRRGGAPYWVHPARVTCLVAAAGGDRVALEAAMAHDVLEDTEVGADALSRRCSPEALRAVEQLTTPPGDRDVVEAHYAALHADGTPAARLVKVADRIDNVCSLRASGEREGLRPERRRSLTERQLRRTRWQVAPLAPDTPLGPRLGAELSGLAGWGGVPVPAWVRTLSADGP